MGVSIESYRQRIGCFSYNRRTFKISSSYNYSSKRTKNLNFDNILSLLLRCLLLFTILQCAAYNSQCTSSSYHKERASLPSHIVPSRQAISPTQCGISWSSANTGNKLVHALVGNKRNIGYKYLAWNCGRGFLSEHKIDVLKVTIDRHKPHMVCVSEVDLHRHVGHIDHLATIHLTDEQIHDKLQIQDYKIYLPKSWEALGIARIIVYVRDDLKSTILHPQDHCYDHLQNITVEVGFGRAKKHFCNFYYREWTSSKTGRNDKRNQQDDLELLLDIWRNCTKDDRDFIAVGDMNLCTKKWNNPNYEHNDLANTMKDFMNEENCSQVVDEYTRVQSVGGDIQRSCLDHAYVNCVEKISPPIILAVGKSDHLGVLLTK